MNNSRLAQEQNTVDPVLAAQLKAAAASIPPFAPLEYYSTEVQRTIHDQVRLVDSAAFDTLLELIGRHLTKSPWFVHLKGLPMDDSFHLFIALSYGLGDMVAVPYQPPRRQLVHHIHPATDRAAYTQTQTETEKMHTDTADWEHPVQYLSMACIQPDQAGGGWSEILQIDVLKALVLEKLGSEILDFLENTPLPWAKAAYQGGGINWRPIFSEGEMCWRRYTIDLGYQQLTQTPDPKIVDILEAFEKLIAATTAKTRFFMAAGDLLLVNNLQTLHARDRIPNMAETERFMVRGWIQRRNQN